MNGPSPKESLTMISPADDFLIHQTPEPILHVATSDRRFYDRYFLALFALSEDGLAS